MLDVWLALSLPRLPACLDNEERERRDRFVCPQAAALFEAAHTLKRHVLSWHDPATAPQAWRFGQGSRGKPFVLAAEGPRFNLSHSGTCIAVAVCDAEVGVDIERHRDLPAMPSLAAMVFHPDEHRWWTHRGRSATDFFRLWTLKEALLKAAGVGFSMPAATVAWEGLDEPWPQARLAGRVWRGCAVPMEGATLAVAVPWGDGHVPGGREAGSPTGRLIEVAEQPVVAPCGQGLAPQTARSRLAMGAVRRLPLMAERLHA